jgi:small nuclear ribonucleoprotein (snRNP)-like protein
MNLVIDDAVEVKQPTKTDPEEKRRELGTDWPTESCIGKC